MYVYISAYYCRVMNTTRKTIMPGPIYYCNSYTARDVTPH